MESIVVLGFMMIPIFGSMQYASIVLIPAIVADLLLLRHPAVFKVVPFITFFSLLFLFIYLSKGEVGRNGVFQGIFALTFTIGFILYLLLHRSFLKNQLKKNKNSHNKSLQSDAPEARR